MPLDKFVLVLVIVITAAGATIWVGAMVAASIQMPFGWGLMIPAALVAYVLWRVIGERLANREDDHYERIEK